MYSLIFFPASTPRPFFCSNSKLHSWILVIQQQLDSQSSRATQKQQTCRKQFEPPAPAVVVQRPRTEIVSSATGTTEPVIQERSVRVKRYETVTNVKILKGRIRLRRDNISYPRAIMWRPIQYLWTDKILCLFTGEYLIMIFTIHWSFPFNE